MLRFGLDMPKQRLKMLKKIIQSPHMKAAKADSMIRGTTLEK
jgi:hypothetical protein